MGQCTRLLVVTQEDTTCGSLPRKCQIWSLPSPFCTPLSFTDMLDIFEIGLHAIGHVMCNIGCFVYLPYLFSFYEYVYVSCVLSICLLL